MDIKLAPMQQMPHNIPIDNPENIDKMEVHVLLSKKDIAGNAFPITSSLWIYCMVHR